MADEVQLPSAPALSTHIHEPASTAHSCPSCGTTIAINDEEFKEAKRTISELQVQMEALREKATAAVEKCAEYEEQIHVLKMASYGSNRSAPDNTSTSFTASSPDGHPPTASATHTRTQSRFSFLTGRLASPVNSTTTPPLPTPTSKPSVDPDLLHELERERALRAKAEDRVRTVDSEIEELSVTLFSQANEMVAEERRARAKLEERIELLEKKDKDKMARLDRLEKAISRIDRVKALLNKDDTVETVNPSLLPPARS